MSCPSALRWLRTPALCHRQERDSVGSYLGLPQAAGRPCNAVFLKLWATHLSQPGIFIGHHLAVFFSSRPPLLFGYLASCGHYVYMTLDKTKLLPWSDYDRTTEARASALIRLKSEFENSDWNRRTPIETLFLPHAYVSVGV